MDRHQPLTILSRRPAISVAVASILGILLHPRLPDLPGLYLILAGVGAVAALLLNRKTILANTAVFLAILFIGLALGRLHRVHYPPDHIVAFTSSEPSLAEMELVIDQPPRTINVPARFSHGTEPRQITLATVSRIRTISGWQETTGAVSLSIAPPVQELAYGQRVRVLATLHRPAPAGNPGQFDWQRYYRDQRILAAVHTDGPCVRITAGGSFSPLQWLRAQARDALARGFSDDRSLDHALLRALVLGDYDPQLRDVQDDFQRTGTSHHLAISGLHVAVLGAVVFFFCRLIRLSPRAAAWTMMGFVLLYGVVALPSPPVVRSILLCTVFAMGVLLKRPVDGVQLLAFTVIAMLVYDPLDLYNPGFQLSFGTVLGLMILATPLARTLHQPDEDERVLRSFGIEPSRAAGILRWLRDATIRTAAAGMVAWAISAPIIMQHFDQLNPWAIPASMLLAPAVFLSLVAGLFKILLTLLIPGLSGAWAPAAALPVAFMRWTVGQLARIPGSELPMPAMWIGLIVIYYAIIALPMIPVGRAWLRHLLRGGAATAMLALFLLPLLTGFAPRRGGELSLTLLSVGPGQCAVVSLPSGRAILIDAGSSSTPDLSRRILAPFLRKQGIARIDSIILSHANLDHFNAAGDVAQKYGPLRVQVAPPFSRHARKNPAAAAMLNRFEQLGCRVDFIHAGRSIPLDAQTTLEVLWPAGDSEMDPNNASLVLKLTCRGQSILFTGDIQKAAQLELLTTPEKLQSSILIAPHHGSADESTEDLLKAVAPKYILASSDHHLSTKQRRFDDLATSRVLLRTATSGAITVTISSDGKLNVKEYLTRR